MINVALEVLHRRLEGVIGVYNFILFLSVISHQGKYVHMYGFRVALVSKYRGTVYL